jgi:hypothetical protein
MVSHFVLFRPKADLTAQQEEIFLQALDRALVGVPAIARASFGRRRILGRNYDALAPADYEYCAVIEFADEAALRVYLDHPAHEQLAKVFYGFGEAVAAFDYEMVDAANVRTLLTPRA